VTTYNNYVNSDEGYRLNPKPIPYPSPRVPTDETARNILNTVDQKRTFGEVLQSLNIQPVFNRVNRIRVQLTTPLFPYLKAVVR
jgi:hypothetical protein